METKEMPLMQIRSLGIEQDDLDARMLQSVKAAKDAGASWAEIAGCLGITRQAAQQKYGPKIQTTPAAPAPADAELWTKVDVSGPAVTPSMIVAPEPPAEDPAVIVQRHASEIAYKFWSEAKAEGREAHAEWDQDKGQLTIVVRNISIQRGWVMLSQITTQHATRRSHRHYYLRAYSQTAAGRKISRYDAFKAIRKDEK